MGPATQDPPAVTGHRRSHTALVVAIALACVMAAFVALLATRSSAIDKQARSPLLGLPAPGISAPDLNGKTVQLAAYRGKFVLLNFFASWCIPCQIEHPQLLQWTARHEAKGDVQVVAVIFEDTAANARTFMAERGGDWPILPDNGPIALDYGVRGPPESYFIDPNGIVLAKFVGRVSADGLDRVLAQASGATS